MELNVEATAGISDLNLADAGLGVSFARRKCRLTEDIPQGPVTPTFEAICMDRHGVLRKRQTGRGTPSGGRLTEANEADSPTTQGGFLKYEYAFEEEFTSPN